MTPYGLLERYPDRTRPLVTYYGGPENRIELSVASVANAVAKASSMLRDGLGLTPGSIVSVDLPRHWQLPVWVLAALSAGAQVGRDLGGDVAVRVMGPTALEAAGEGQDLGADEVLVSSCDAFGMPVPGGVPATVIDIAVEVRGYPDSYAPEPGAAEAASLVVGGVAVPYDRLVVRPSLTPGARSWIDTDSDEADLLGLVVESILVQGSVVIGVGLDPDRAATLRGVESAALPGAPSAG